MMLAARDLASGSMIAWTGIPSGSATHVARAVAVLFRLHGAPLVLKSDNGSCFISQRFRTLLARFGVVHLRSPRSWPSYNGSCESGIGMLRAMTGTLAATQGRQHRWTSEDMEMARTQAEGLMVRRSGRLLRSRDVWRARRPVRSLDRRRLRRRFLDILTRMRARESDPHRHRSRLRRRALEDALKQLGYLTITKGWVRARSRPRR
jgi:hypothetical protein